ncbi:HD domain-containing protein [Gilvibacter sediminis]|uniref:HD domain-containing protein n=1 Tax=Gilvibacter sediminis TaxID=379071 RepID=UPI002350807D|nr:HD domain-containing protein [Gilvibacter sediminis]MDC7998268.1 HD domain-containing protein [Gilvibacter sediminis]
MKNRKKLTLFNDPIYGFITIPNALVFDLIEHTYFQRLRRITQMGMSYLVFPGAHHTRFHHALGCMHLMQKAVQVLRYKGIVISSEEEEALYVAILLHDIGHGPFSHALEHSLVTGVDHEQISLQFMEALNKNFNERLTLAISIFNDSYPRKFLHQLVSGQLDMDRLDYLKRDSFYTGASEGNINSERLISMLNVANDELVVESKAIYSVEKFLVARRLMYWSVYLHKTGLAAEQVLIRVLQRAKELISKGDQLQASEPLMFFLKRDSDVFEQEALAHFARMDDHDIIQALKGWCDHKDPVLSKLSNMILDRDLPKVKLKNKKPKNAEVDKKREALAKAWGISMEDTNYFIFDGKVTNRAYRSDSENINLLSKNGKLIDVAKASDQLNLKALTQEVTKHYLCYPKAKHY